MLNLTPIINGDSVPLVEEKTTSIVTIELLKTDSMNILVIKQNPDLLQKFDEYDLKVFLEEWTGTEINQVEMK